MKTRYTFCIISFLAGIAIILPYSINDAYAVCCFPYEITHYVDPYTGHLIVEGQLWNDSYRYEPFGNVNYQFEFLDSENNILFERDLSLTDGHSIKNGFVIPPIVALPFHIIIDDMDEEVIRKIQHVRSGGSNTLEYFSWKPADLEIQLGNLEQTATIHDKENQDIFYKWKVSGTITNTHSERAENVYVVTSLLDVEDRFLGTAGYSNDDMQPMQLEGFETKEFVIYSVLPKDKTPVNVSLYAESDNSSMVHQYYKPLILKDVIDFEGRHATDPKKPILISANVTNISRENFDLDWIIQIKKSPKSILESDMTKYPQSRVEFIKIISTHIEGQQSILLEYPWVPQYGGIYFYEMFLWDDNKPLSYPFTGNFFSQGEMFVYPSLYSIKNQIASGKSFDELVCREGLEITHKASNANFICVKPDSIPKLVERGQIKESTIATGIISALKSVQFDKNPIEGDIHYDKVYRDKKYWATLKDIKLLDDESIKITFAANNYRIEWSENNQPNIFQIPDFEYTAIIKKDQTFAPLCTDTSKKQIHVLKYVGITQKDGIDYFTFWHKSADFPDYIECKYPDIIKYSLGIDFDLGDDPPMSPVWDHDWD